MNGSKCYRNQQPCHTGIFLLLICQFSGIKCRDKLHARNCTTTTILPHHMGKYIEGTKGLDHVTTSNGFIYCCPHPMRYSDHSVLNCPPHTMISSSHNIVGVRLEGGNGFCCYTDWTIYMQRLVPPELVCYKIKDGKHKRDNLQFCDGQMFNFTYRALEYEPTHLNNHNPFGEKVSFTLVSNFFLGDIGEVNIVGIREELEIFWGKSVLCFSILEASHKCKKNMRLGPSTT